MHSKGDTTMHKKSAAHYASLLTPKQRTTALLIVALAFVMDLLDTTIVNIAIPSIQTHLHASFAALQWIVAGYALTFALLLITGGRMGDAFGYRKIFLTGVAGFTLASLLGGIAPNAPTLVLARLAQGSMAALMVPQVMALLQVLYKPAERVKVMGMFGMLGGLAGSLGPILGGLLIRFDLFGLSWRPIFLINVPVGIIAFIAATSMLPEGGSSRVNRLDITGTVLVIIALGLLIFPLIEGRQLGWPTWSISMLVAAIPAWGIFGAYELRKAKTDESALLVPSLFAKHTFTRGIILNMLLTAIMIGFFLTFTLMLQIGLGFSVLRAALTALPTAFGIGGSIAIAGQSLVTKFGARVVAAGSILSAIGLSLTVFMFDHYGLALHAWQLIPVLFLNGVGVGLMIAPMSSIALQEIDPEHAGAASGIFNAIQQVGGALGVALIGIVFFGHLGNMHSISTSFAHAYKAGMLFELGILAVLFGLSFTLPKHLKLVEAS